MPIEDQITAAKHRVTQEVSFGQRVAEEESKDLATYFVETEHWRLVWAGDVDVVFAPKGGGKSAIYSMLVSRESELFDRGILLAAGESPTGAPVFDQVDKDPPTDETEFVGLWKLYFLTLIAQVLDEYGIGGPASDELIEQLRDAGLLTGDRAKRKLVRRVMNYIRRYFRPASAETSLNLDPVTAMPTGVTGKIVFQDPPEGSRGTGSIYIDDLYGLADEALKDADYQVWLILDRLDVAFAESQTLEKNALRALFRAYRDLRPLEKVSLKIFLRSDIWRAITAEGFREASHITRELNLEWNKGTLLQLVMQRLVRCQDLCDYYGVNSQEVLANVAEQRALFGRVYPQQVDPGERKLKTFDWCLSRTRDGYGRTTPRELIHLLAATREQQLRRYEIGEPPPADEAIFDRQALKDALPEVSEVRLTKTLYAEYPNLRSRVERLDGQKTLHNDASLAAIWGTNIAEVRQIAERLVEIGFFEHRGDRQNPQYWVPFLYRPALRLIQGSADGVVAPAADDS